MTNTSPSAVERFRPEWYQQFDSRVVVYMTQETQGDYVKYDDYAALSAQLAAANQRHAAALEAVALASKRADAMRDAALEEAAVVADEWYRHSGKGTPGENIRAIAGEKP